MRQKDGLHSFYVKIQKMHTTQAHNNTKCCSHWQKDRKIIHLRNDNMWISAKRTEPTHRKNCAHFVCIVLPFYELHFGRLNYSQPFFWFGKSSPLDVDEPDWKKMIFKKSYCYDCYLLLLIYNFEMRLNDFYLSNGQVKVMEQW